MKRNNRRLTHLVAMVAFFVATGFQPAECWLLPDFDPAHIQGVVWLDADRDGLHSPTEPGVEGVLVNLTTVSGGYLTSTITDENGRYELEVTSSSAHRVRFAPSLYALTTMDVGDDDTIDSDADPATGLTAPISLAQRTTGTMDAGVVYEANSSIIGWLWIDEDRDGIQDLGEPPYLDAMVTLLDSTGTEIALTAPNQYGAYDFELLTPGEYQVRFETVWAITTPDAGPDAEDSDADPSSGLSPILTLGMHDIASVDAGVLPDDPPPTGPASIGGRVWLDANENGRQDAGELNWDDIRVELLDATGAELAFTFPDGDGLYSFPDLDPGDYQVHFNTGFELTAPDVGGDDTIDSDADPTTKLSPLVSLGAGESIALDAGLLLP
jgi:hypothetical protein